MYDSWLNYLQLVLVIGIPLMMISFGGLFTERSGVTNIALEGLMVLGAFTGILFMFKVPAESVGGPAVLFILGSLVAVITGVVVSFIHSAASVSMKADQIISATAINTLAPALAFFIVFSMGIGDGQGSEKIPIDISSFKITEIPLLSKIPFIGDLLFSNVYVAVYIGIALIIALSIIFYKTKFGLRLRSCGENPHAADAAGINIYKMRYIGVAISGALAALGGFYFITGYTNLFIPYSSSNGYGFLAIAILIFGNWKPGRIVLTAIFFTAILTLSDGVAFFPFLENLHIDESIWAMVPYVLTIVVLVFTSKNSAAPAAVGQVYDKGER